MTQVGITERGDAALNIDWLYWVKEEKPAILISKDPTALASRIHGYHIEDSNIIVHCTITGLKETEYEPNVPFEEDALRGYETLVNMLGADRVVLRVDPIIPSIRGYFNARRIISQHLNTRIRISFLDNYPHVKKRFKDAGLDPLPYSFHAPLRKRKAFFTQLNEVAGREIEVCGEPGFSSVGCISAKDCKIFGVTPAKNKCSQRNTCACLAMKKELLNKRGRCNFSCLYCYWKD